MSTWLIRRLGIESCGMDSQRKRKASPELIPNPFIKKRNLEWQISPPLLRNPERRRPNADVNNEAQAGDKSHQCMGEGPDNNGPGDEAEAPVSGGTLDPEDEGEDIQAGSQEQPISPPPTTTTTTKPKPGASTSALIESAQLKIDDHLAYFTSLLTSHVRQPWPPSHPRLPVPAYAALYTHALDSPRGAHFVVTQHDHPVAGPHYDLRLQIDGASSCSWAIMYGLPGDPNARGRSGRVGAGVLRNATETRVHCLWNHLVETAGRDTGSLLIWDTGQYEILPPVSSANDKNKNKIKGSNGRGGRPSDSGSSEEEDGNDDDDNDNDNDNGQDPGEGVSGSWEGMTQQQRLAKAFAARKIRLKLHGARLPRTYVVNLRLTKNEDAAARAKAAARWSEKPRRRRRRGSQVQKNKTKKQSHTGPDTSSSSSSNSSGGEGAEETYNDGSRGKSAEGLSEMEKELRELEDEEVRRTNAYTGAVNTIGSVHQRKWFLSLDRETCGFVRTKKEGRVWWERKAGHHDDMSRGEEASDRLKWPFYVRGPEHERSVVTGRLGADLLRDEGVVGYIGRKGWRPILN